MKKLKSIFSPRKLIVWLFVVALIIAMPELTRPSLSQTEALVSMMCVEKKDGKYEIATTILTPGQERKVNNQVYTGSGETLGEAVNNIAISLGKEMAFAQCEIVAFGEKICEESVIPSIDFMTRTKRVGRSAVLINFTGEAGEFAQAVTKLSQDKALRLDQIMHYDERYILSKYSNIDSFYKGYYSPIKTGIMPQIRLESSEMSGAIEVAASSESSSSGGQTQGQSGSGGEQKKYLINDGTMCVFYNGSKRLDLSPEQMQDINILQDNKQEGVLKVDGVTDEIYNDATIVFALTKKEIKLKPDFDGDKPIYTMDVEIRVLVDEVIDKDQSNKFLRRNKEFLTPAALKKLEETLHQKMMDTIEFCKTNEIDLINVYREFNAKHYKKFQKHYQKYQEKYLDGIEYKINIEINSAY